jgi:hypothetical protein
VNKREIVAALKDLGSELESRVVTARLHIVGGSVMVVAFESREGTEDIDGDFYPPEDVLAASEVVGKRRGLNDGWLSNSAKIFVSPFNPPTWSHVVKYGSLEVSYADARSMLAMKLRAARGRRDQLDIEVLLEMCGTSTSEAAIQLYEEYFPEDPLKPRAHKALELALVANLKRQEGHSEPPH